MSGQMECTNEVVIKALGIHEDEATSTTIWMFHDENINLFGTGIEFMTNDSVLAGYELNKLK